MISERLGHYELVEELGAGGMGVVYRARDTRLDRAVALKLVAPHLAGDADLRARFQREARLAAGVNHPNVCQIYDIGEQDGRLFLAMELLEGEPLEARIGRGALSVPEALQVLLGVLGALEALHRKGIVHRDLKPSNVFLTPHGVKLLDFGLAAQPVPTAEAGADLETRTRLTQPGVVLGTCSYMAPEQARGGPADARADIFACGAILFEMLTGRRAFQGESPIEVLHAVVHDQPPAMTGSPAISGADRIARRALAKRREDRYPSAEAMARDVRAALLLEDSGAPARAHTVTRIIVLPFRMLREDAEVEFLSFSLPDAIGGSLSALDSVVVRSSAVAARFEGAQADLEAVAAEAEVDAIVLGTLLRAGDKVGVSAQLVEAASGTVLWSQSSSIELRDVFQVQEELVRRIVESLAVPLTASDQGALRRDVPATPSAYEYYLRANQLSRDHSHLAVARDLYLQAVEEDPRYAPAWARLGRVYRMLAKYSGEQEHNLERAEDALRRALEINPDLAIAHNYYAHLEADLGRAPEALERLIVRAQQRRNDPELFAGLVHVCRYSGLLAASVAAHEQVRRLDPHLPTSVTHTYFMMGDHDRTIETSALDIYYVDLVARMMAGREDEALDLVRRRARSPHRLINCYLDTVQAHLEGDAEKAGRIVEEAIALGFRDPEALFYFVRHLAALGHADRALELLVEVAKGYFCFDVLAADPWLDALRGRPEFQEILRSTRARQQANAELLARHDRARLLAAGG